MSNNYWDKDKNKMRCVWGKCKFNDMTLQIGGFCSHKKMTEKDYNHKTTECKKFIPDENKFKDY